MWTSVDNSGRNVTEIIGSRINWLMSDKHQYSAWVIWLVGDGSPVRECLHLACTQAQTDGQVENMTPQRPMLWVGETYWSGEWNIAWLLTICVTFLRKKLSKSVHVLYVEIITKSGLLRHSVRYFNIAMWHWSNHVVWFVPVLVDSHNQLASLREMCLPVLCAHASYSYFHCVVISSTCCDISNFANDFLMYLISIVLFMLLTANLL